MHGSSTTVEVTNADLRQIQLAEVEQASLMSEQLSDKSSSLALPDDLSLDEHSNYQLLVRDSQVLVHTNTHTPKGLRSYPC